MDDNDALSSIEEDKKSVEKSLQFVQVVVTDAISTGDK